MRTQSLPFWLAVALCFAIPVYAQFLWGGPPADVGIIPFIVGTIILGAWLSMPQILVAAFIYSNRPQPVRWALLILSAGAVCFVGKMISFPFTTASSMATAHVFAPVYAAAGVIAGGAAVLAVAWLIGGVGGGGASGPPGR